MNINSIPERLNFIKSLLNGKEVNLMMNLDNNETENILIHNNHKEENKDCSDIRCILNKKIFDFKKIINNIGGKLCYIKSGSTGHTFKGFCNKTGKKYAVKIVAYPKTSKYGDLYNVKRPENAELLIIKLLSYFVINKQSPHIVLPICTFNTTIKPFINISCIDNKKYDLFIKKVKKNLYFNEVSVLMSEWADGGDLLDYIRQNYKTFTTRHWRVIFFQILSVLAVIQNKYESFRHNDLKANNILIQNINMVDKVNNKFKYNINNQEYIVPNIGIITKIWDFDFATIPGIIDNAKVEAEWTDKINIFPKRNKYYDMHYFFNTLSMKGFFPEILDSNIVHKSVGEFIRRIVPVEYSKGKNVTDRGRIKINKEINTPDNVLRTDPFFKKMRKN